MFTSFFIKILSLPFSTCRLLDILMRYLIMAGCRYPHIASLELMADDIVKVSFVKPDGFQYNAGQFVQIAFPDLGLYAFHPISISSSPHESSVTLHVRGLGSWSNKLVELAQVKDEAPILIEGPYGSISVDLDSDDRYQIVVLISGGIGVTHTQSVAKSLLHEHRNGRKLRHLRFVWAIRDLKMLEAIEPLDEPISRFRDIELTETSKIQTNVVDLDKTAPEMPSLVQTDVFLTKASREMPITMDDGRNLYFGRPDIDVIISDVKEVAKRQGVTHVAVVVCGPKPLVDKVKNVCRQKSNVMSKVKFDVHQEIFDF